MPAEFPSPKKAETAKAEVLERYIPDELFKAWVEANLMHPQEGTGIMIKVGEKLYGGHYSLDDFAQCDLSSEQLSLVKQRMFAAHRARSIESKLLKNDKEINDSIARLWGGFRSRVLIFGANYATRFLKQEETLVSRYADPTTKTFAVPYLTTLNKGLEVKPELLQEMAEVFKVLKNSLELEEVKELEKKRRDLLDYKEQGPPAHGLRSIVTKKGRERKSKSKEARGLITEISNFVYTQTAEALASQQLSIDLSSGEKIRSLFKHNVSPF